MIYVFMKYRSVIQSGILALVMSFLMQGCAEDVVSMSQKPILLSATNNDHAFTRATTNIQSKAFDDGETILTYIVTTSGNNQIGGTSSDPITYCTAANDGTDVNVLTPSPQPYYPEDGTIDVLGLYPKRVKRETDTFVVDYKQNEVNYKNNDLMWAQVKGQIMTDKAVLLQFAHKMAKIIINVTGQEDVEIKGVKLINVNRSVPFDSSTGGLGTPSADKADNGEIEMEVGGAALLPPQIISGEFIEVTTNHIPARFSLDSKNFEEGKEYTINLIIGRQNLGLTTNIVNWANDAGAISVTPPDPNAVYVADIEAITYDPEKMPYEPHPVIKENSSATAEKLVEGTDYELQYFGNDKAGTGTMLMIGKGVKWGNTALVRSFIIRQATGELSYPKANHSVYYDNGAAVTGNDLVKTGDGTMTFTSSDPTVATISSDGVVTMRSVGTTTITASMANDKNYTAASASYELSIEKRTASGLTITLVPDTYVYDGTAHEPGVTVKDGANTLTKGVHYTVAYSNNTNKGTATVTVTGAGDYSGTITKDFTITQASNKMTINGLEVTHDATDIQKTTVSNSLAMSIPVDGQVNRGATSIWGVATYTSSNSNVATVSSTGVLTGKAAGTATITVSVAEPSDQNYYGVSITYTVTVVSVNQEFGYTGKVQAYTCSLDGTYKLEVYGAQGYSPTTIYNGGKGAYVAGTVSLKKGQVLYVYVGGAGSGGTGGWNGGGSAGSNGNGGGGATDIALCGTNGSTTWNDTNHLNSRIIVAGGGGGALYYWSGNFFTSGYGNGGYGGAWDGRAGTGASGAGGGATRKSGGSAGNNGSTGSFGIGGNYNGSVQAGAGGGGWYGGGAGGDTGRHGAGGGGSSYMWNSSNASYYSGHGTSNAPIVPSSSTVQDATKFYLKEVSKNKGERSGNGLARITFISTD